MVSQLLNRAPKEWAQLLRFWPALSQFALVANLGVWLFFPEGARLACLLRRARLFGQGWQSEQRPLVAALERLVDGALEPCPDRGVLFGQHERAREDFPAGVLAAFVRAVTPQFLTDLGVHFLAFGAQLLPWGFRTPRPTTTGVPAL
jgi:hypothetical protein